MAFTDEDLKRLKAHEGYEFTKMNEGQSETWAFVDSAKIDALLARLEAAEAYVKFDHQNWIEGGPKQEALYQAWRKAAGK